MVGQQEERVLEQRGRAAVAPDHVERRDLGPQVPLPHQLAVHVERDDLARAEPGVDHLPVGDRARRREVVLVVHAGQRARRLEPVFPQALAVGAVEGFDEEEGAVVAAALRVERPLAGGRGVPALHEAGMVARRADAAADLRRHDDAVAADDRRRHAKPRERRLPRDVLGGAPLLRQLRLRRRPGARRTTPRRPVGRAHRHRREHRQHRFQGEERSCAPPRRDRLQSCRHASDTPPGTTRAPPPR